MALIINDKTVNFEDYLRFVGEQSSQFMARPSAFEEEFLQETPTRIPGDRLPWSKTHDDVAMGEGQISVWAGINGHGKSEVVGMVMAWLMPTSPVCIASMEMKPRETMLRMCKQTGGIALPSVQYKKEWLNWAESRLWIYDQLETVSTDKMLGMVHYAFHELGCKHVVIDSLAKCGIPRDDYSKQASFVDQLQNAAKRWGVHVHLVAHMRKGRSEDEVPGKFDLRGAGELSDYVDNMFIVWRNKKREQLLRAQDPLAESMSDSMLIVAKNRHGGQEPSIPLWRHQSGQYLERNTSQKMLHPAGIMQ